MKVIDCSKKSLAAKENEDRYFSGSGGTVVVVQIAVNLVSEKIRTLSAALLVVCSTTSATVAGNDRGAAGVSGFVTPALRLSIGAALSAGSAASLVMSQPDLIRVSFSGGPGVTSTIIVPLEIRTNAEYQLTAALDSIDGHVAGLVASIDSVSESGPFVVSGAAAAAQVRTGVNLTSRPALLLNGPRVSKAGGFESPKNALILQLAIKPMDAGADTLPWHASLTLSLRPV